MKRRPLNRATIEAILADTPPADQADRILDAVDPLWKLREKAAVSDAARLAEFNADPLAQHIAGIVLKESAAMTARELMGPTGCLRIAAAVRDYLTRAS